MELFTTFLPLVLIFAVFYFILVRPQHKKMKQYKEMVSNLKKGDEVVTSGGIIGVISNIDNNKEQLILKVAENVEIKIASGMISDKVGSTQ